MSDNKEYLAKRQLKRGSAGWILLAGLGVSYVISGDFAGWLFFEENIPVIENLFFGEFCFFGVVTIFTVFLRLTFLFD